MTSLSQWQNVFFGPRSAAAVVENNLLEQKCAKLATQDTLKPLSIMVAFGWTDCVTVWTLEPVGNSGPGSPGLFGSQVTDQRVGELRGRENLSRPAIARPMGDAQLGGNPGAGQATASSLKYHTRGAASSSCQSGSQAGRPLSKPPPINWLG